MSDGTKIEWTDATANVVNGCSVVSPGCTNCYAMRLAGTRMRNHPTRAGLTRDSKAGPVWTGEVRFNEAALQQVLRWSRPRMIFWNAHGDLFHPNVPDEWIDRCFAAMAMTPQHKHQVLTKRPERMRAWFADNWRYESIYNALGRLGRDGHVELHPYRRAFPNGMVWPLPNVWLGTSVEDQQRANERIPHLLATPAAVRWLSCEPLLGPVDLTRHLAPRWPDCNCTEGPLAEETVHDRNLVERCPRCNVALGGDPRSGLGWIVAGGESGHGARPMHPDWARSLRDQCGAAGVPFLFKQWGEWAPHDGRRDIEYALTAGRAHWCGDYGPWLERIGKRAAGRLLDGVQYDGYPG